MAKRETPAPDLPSEAQSELLRELVAHLHQNRTQLREEMRRGPGNGDFRSLVGLRAKLLRIASASFGEALLPFIACPKPAAHVVMSLTTC
jgi:hypothetical protein